MVDPIIITVGVVVRKCYEWVVTNNDPQHWLSFRRWGNLDGHDPE